MLIPCCVGAACLISSRLFITLALSYSAYFFVSSLILLRVFVHRVCYVFLVALYLEARCCTNITPFPLLLGLSDTPTASRKSDQHDQTSDNSDSSCKMSCTRLSQHNDEMPEQMFFAMRQAAKSDYGPKCAVPVVPIGCANNQVLVFNARDRDKIKSVSHEAYLRSAYNRTILPQARHPRTRQSPWYICKPGCQHIAGPLCLVTDIKSSEPERENHRLDWTVLLWCACAVVFSSWCRS